MLLGAGPRHAPKRFYMEVTVLTYGTRGDVQPFLALAVGFQKVGHAVKLAAPHRFNNFVNAYGVSSRRSQSHQSTAQ